MPNERRFYSQYRWTGGRYSSQVAALIQKSEDLMYELSDTLSDRMKRKYGDRFEEEWSKFWDAIPDNATVDYITKTLRNEHKSLDYDDYNSTIADLRAGLHP